MFKQWMLSSCVSVLLVGCSTTETKPVTVSTTTPSAPAKLTPPAVKAVKPVLKPKVAGVKPKTAPVKAAEPVAVNSDVALGKQWASCAGDLEGLHRFIAEVIKSNPYPQVMQTPAMQTQFASFQQLPTVRDSLNAYAQAASANPSLVAKQYAQVHNQQYAQYMRDADPLFKAFKASNYDPMLKNEWQTKYFKQVFGMMGNLTDCVMRLEQDHSRFDAQVTPKLHYKFVSEILTKQANTTATHQSEKPSKKRARKAS